MISSGANPTTRRPGLFVRPFASAASAALSLVLLAPLFYGFLLVPQPEACAMSCCRKSGAKCPHHSRAASSQDAPAITPAPACPNGCRGQAAGLPGPVAATPGAQRAAAGPAPLRARLGICPPPSRAREETRFPLFERPPPSC